MTTRIFPRIVTVGLAAVCVVAPLIGCGPQPGAAPTAAPVTEQDKAVLDKIRNRRSGQGGKTRRGNNPPSASVPQTAP